MVVNMQRTVKWTELKMAQITIMNDIQIQSTDPIICKNAITASPAPFDEAKAANQTAGLPVNWKLSDGTILRDPGGKTLQTLENYANLKLKRLIFVANLDAGGNPVKTVLPNGSTLYEGHVEFTSVGDVGAGTQGMAPKVSSTMFLTVTPAGAITDCSASQAVTMENVCGSLSGTYDSQTGKCAIAPVAGGGGGGAQCPCGNCGITRSFSCPGEMRYPGTQTCTRTGWVTTMKAGCINRQGVYTEYDPDGRSRYR